MTAAQHTPHRRRHDAIAQMLHPLAESLAREHGVEHELVVTTRGIELTGQGGGNRHTDVLVTGAELDSGGYEPLLAGRAKNIFMRAAGLPAVADKEKAA
jgi:hypothetical protein